MRTASLDRLCETALLVLLAFSILWKGGKTLESTWLLVGVTGLCTLVQQLGRRREVRMKDREGRLHLVVFLLIFWIILSYTFSKTLNYGLDEVLRDGSLGLLLLWYINRGEGDAPSLTSQTFEEHFLTWMARLTVASCIIGILIYLFQPVNRFVGTFMDPRFHTDYWPNAFAEFLLLAWPIVLLKDPGHGTRDLRLHTSTPLSKILSPKSISRFSLGFVFASLFLTYSRGAFVAFLGQIGFLLALFFMSRNTGKDVRKPLTILAPSLVIGIVLFFSLNGLRSFFHPVQSLSEKATFTAEEGTSSISERKEFWKQALKLTAEKPLFGWGPGSFRFVQPRLQEQVLATSDHPHNVFLKLSAERGIVPPILFGILAAFALLMGMKTTLAGKRLRPEADHMRLEAPLLTVAIAGTFAHNLIDYNLQFVGIALPFWMIMSFLARSPNSATGERSQARQLPIRPPVQGPPFGPEGPLVQSQWQALSGRTPQGLERRAHGREAIFNSLIAFVLLLIALREGVYLVTSSVGRHAETQGNAEKALQWYRHSEQEWFTRDMHLSEANLLLKEGREEEAEAAVQTYLTENAEDARAWKLLGEILVSKDDFSGAIEAYERAFALGAWNNLSISRGLLESLFAETYTQPISDAAADSLHLPLHPRIVLLAPEIERRVLAFADAIMENRHFAALSPNPEEAGKLLITLAVLHPEKEKEYRALRERIEAATERERTKVKARPPGWLW